MINPNGILSLFNDTTTTKIFTPQIDGYAIVPIEADARIRVIFDDYERYLVITSNTAKLFCNNDYYGAVMIEYRRGYTGKIREKTVRTYCLRASAAVISNRAGAHIITPIDQNADIVYDHEFNADGLTRHFMRQYHMLLKEDPEAFQKNLDHLLTMKLDFVVRPNCFEFA